MPDTTVKCFRNTDGGAPTLNNATGCLIALLDACLVDGYGSKTLSSLVVASGVATATVSTGHEFTNFGDTGVGPVVLVAGATPSELNGEKRINVTSATTFTFDATGVADGTATGTITAKMAPVGWEKVYSGTNKAVYRPTDVTSNRMYLRVDDTGAASARVRGYESMSDVDTGTGPFPTDAQMSGGGYFHKSNAATARDWMLVADSKGLHLVGDYAGNNSFLGGLSFCDLSDVAAGDAYATDLYCQTSNTSDNLIGSSSTVYVPRNSAGTPGAVGEYKSMLSKNFGFFVGGEPLPTANDGKLRFLPIEHCTGDSQSDPYRGMVPGLLSCPVAAPTGFQYHGIATGPFAGSVAVILRAASWGSNGVGFQLVGPW